MTTELRRRVGGSFTLRELADAYSTADAWARHVLAEQGAPDWPRTLTLVEGAAFHLYSRGAADYAAVSAPERSARRESHTGAARRRRAVRTVLVVAGVVLAFLLGDRLRAHARRAARSRAAS